MVRAQRQGFPVQHGVVMRNSAAVETARILARFIWIPTVGLPAMGALCAAYPVVAVAAVTWNAAMRLRRECA